MTIRAPVPLPFEVGQLGNFQARMLRTFRAAVDDWDDVCSALADWEAEHLTRDEAEPAKAQHRAWLTELLSWGQLVQRATAHPEFPDQALAARVNARLGHLHDKLALWNLNMTTEEEARILLAAFP